jgi:hypothetical protein
MIITVFTSPYHFHHHYHHQNHHHSFDHFTLLLCLFSFWYLFHMLYLRECNLTSLHNPKISEKCLHSTWNMFNFMHDFKPRHIKIFVMYLGKYNKRLSYILSLFCIQYSHPSVHFCVLVPETSVLIFIIWSHFTDSQDNKHCHNCGR